MSRFKRIADYTTEDLKAGIEDAVDHCKEHGLDFFSILKGIDCYFEQRKRKLELEASLSKQKETDPLGR